MARLWHRLDRKLALAVVAVAAAALGGCGVSKEEYNALKSENEELRTKVSTVENSTRDKDTQIADLSKKVNDLESQKAAPMSEGGSPTGGRGKRSDGGGGGDVVLEVAGDVLFDPGQAVVKGSAKKQLDHIVAQLNGQ